MYPMLHVSGLRMYVQHTVCEIDWILCGLEPNFQGAKREKELRSDIYFISWKQI